MSDYNIGGIDSGLNPMGKIILPSEKRSRVTAAHHNNIDSGDKMREKRVRASGANVGAILYWGFFSLIALSIMAALISNTKFAEIQQQVLVLFEGQDGDSSDVDRDIGLMIENLEAVVDKQQFSGASAADMSISQEDILHIVSAKNALQSMADVEAGRSKDIEAIYQNVSVGSKIALGMALLIIVLGIALASYIGRTLSSQINHLSDIMYKLAGGDRDVDATPNGKIGIELARMYDAVSVFKEQFIEVQDLRVEEQIKSQKAQELNQTLKETASDVNEQIEAIFEHVKNDQISMMELSKSIEKLSSNLRNAVETTSQSMDSAVSSTNKVKLATKDFVKQIHVMSEGARNSKALTQKAVENAEQSNIRVKSLEDLANNIGNFIGLIRDIADKTNLLALNATIEAVRAGEAGKGFSVVAGEVKSLSNQTSKATEDIAQQVEAIRNEVELTISSIVQVSDIISQLSDFSNEISENVRVQADATEEIASAVNAVSADVETISASIGGLNADAEQNYEVSEKINLTTQQTSQSVEKMADDIKVSLNKLKTQASQ